MWIWQEDNWPHFNYDAKAILPILEQTVRAVSPLCALANTLSLDKQLQLESYVLLEEALASAKIEGEILDRESVRSGIANRLGIGNTQKHSKSDAAYIDILLESIRSAQKPLSEKQLLKWHSMMFLERPILYDMIIGDYRKDEMSVISGRFGKQTIHFNAPCSDYLCVKKQMDCFFDWLNHDFKHDNNSNSHQSGYIKAAIAKFWFVTIHPFDDGNGRFSRLIAESCLAQTEGIQLRLYSISSQIEANKNEYYEILESCQKGTLDTTTWIIWFLQQVTSAAQEAMKILQQINIATIFWDQYRHVDFNQRQQKLLRYMLEQGDFVEGISRKKYRNLNNISDITSTRDLKNLVAKGVMEVSGAGRSVRYKIISV
ncbi:MAG: Fic family protein [gamma proteobacterium symbiont of Taylorina sp.]|nr:Fic family protein [gamma proteobacterium symbiont of Taylorina sp.]